MNQHQMEAMTEFHRHELMLDTPPEELRWLAFVKQVQKLLGHDLDGSDNTDGYSLDTAYDFFSDGLSADEAAVEFKTMKEALLQA